MVFETDVWFNLIKTVLTTTLTLGLMISLTEFRFSGRVVVLAYGGYMLYVAASSALIIMLFGFPTMLSVFLLTITVPAIVVTYILAKDNAMKAIFNYMTQIDICLLLTAPVAVINQGSKILDIFLRAALLGMAIAANYFFIRKPFRRLADILDGSWFFMALVPTVFCILIFLTIRFPVHFTQNPWSLVLLMTIAIVMIVVYFVIFQSLNNSYKLLTYEHEKEFLHTQVDAMKSRMETIRQSADQAAIYRHDLRHHTNLLLEMLGNKDFEEALSYTQKLGNYTTETSTKIYCENAVVNTVLSSLLKMASLHGIAVTCKAVLPAVVDIDEMELCVVLSNLLENAIENCRDDDNGVPALDIFITKNKEQLFIRIQNSFDGKIKQDENGDYLFAKQQGGIGLKSVRAIVAHHDGVINITHTKKTFTVDVAL